MTVGGATSFVSATEMVAGRDTPVRDRVLLLVVACGGAQFSMRLTDVSEVGRLPKLTRMQGSHAAVLGSMVLHGMNVPVIDAGAAIGLTCDSNTNPKMFAATRREPVVCIALDSIIGKHEDDGKDTGEYEHNLVDKLVAIAGRSMPLLNVGTVSRLSESATQLSADTGVSNENQGGNCR